MDPLNVIEYNGYRIEVFADTDAGNPFVEYVNGVQLVLQPQAERHFGWSTDKEWVTRLQAALEQILDQGVVQNLYGPGGALSIVCRWLKVVHRMPVVLPVSVYEHSGVMVYLGNGSHWSDPQGWDSGWIGWLLVTAQDAVAHWTNLPPEKILTGATASFDDFASWVCGDVAWYRILDPDGVELEESSAGGIYQASAVFSEPDGWMLRECRDAIDADIAHRKAGG